MTKKYLNEFHILFQSISDTTMATLSNCIASDAPFQVVMIGADEAPTTRLDFELEKTCLNCLGESGLVSWVLSEESGLMSLSRSGVFGAIIDPLDGTANAEMGFPYYALSVALVDDYGPVAALVMNYATGEMFEAVRGNGARRNAKLLKRTNEIEIQKGCLSISRPLTEVDLPFYMRLMLAAKRVRIASCPSLDIAYVANGTFIGYVDFHIPKGLIHLHDVIAAGLILEECGGIVCNETGEALNINLSARDTFNVFAVAHKDNFAQISALFC